MWVAHGVGGLLWADGGGGHAGQATTLIVMKGGGQLSTPALIAQRNETPKRQTNGTQTTLSDSGTARRSTAKRTWDSLRGTQRAPATLERKVERKNTDNAGQKALRGST
jgi:hypothetical protein